MTRRNVSLADRLGDELRFVKTFATSPLKMGTFTPSGRALAEAMVDHSTVDPTGWTLEIGPGTGAVTEVLIDRGVPRSASSASSTMRISVGCWRNVFPGLHVIQGDALKLAEALGQFAEIKYSAVLSGIPLLNLPKAKRLPYSKAPSTAWPPAGT